MTSHLPAPNPRLLELVSDLVPGRALELGCGNGGDAIWLAQREWTVTALDISATATSRLRQVAERTGLQARITATPWDLNRGLPPGEFDLANAHYLHAQSGLDRTGVFRSAAHALRPGGHLLIVDHGSTAPWSWNQDPDLHYPTPHEVHAEVDLDPARWQVVEAEARQRVASGPDDRTANVADHILMIRRTGS